MKKILLVVVILIVITVAVLVAFILTFDINKYKGVLASQLESLTGNQVDIGRLSLAWKGRIILGIENFTISVDENGLKTPELSFESGQATVELLPMLQRQLEISSLSVMRPKLHLIRTADGKITLRGYSSKAAQPAPQPAPEKPKPAAALAIGLRIASIAIRDGTIRFEDMMSAPPADITIKKIDADVKNLSFITPVQFSSKMAVANDRQNVEFAGVAGGFVTGGIFLKDFTADTDLATFNYADLIKAVPALEKIGIKDGLTGVVKARVRELQLSGNKIAKLSADFDFTGGKIILTQLKVPIDRIDLSASAEGSTVTVRSFNASLSNGNLKGAGKIEDVFATPCTTLQTTADISGVKSFLSSLFPGNQYIDGKLAFSFDGTMTGRQWTEISKTVSGTGTLSLEQGTIVGTNILTESLSALTIFPGILDMVTGSVPQPVKSAFSQDNTQLKPFRQSFTIRNGTIEMPNIVLASDQVSLTGQGNMNLSGDASGNGTIKFAKAVSDAMVQAVSQIKYLTNADGLVEFPVAFKGGPGGFKVIPDLKYVGQRALEKKGEEMVTDMIKKAVEGKKTSQPAQAAPATSGQTQKPTLQDMLKNIESMTKESGASSKTTGQ